MQPTLNMNHYPTINDIAYITRQKKIKQPQQLSKAMGEALFSLFGPNGHDVPVHKSETRRLAAFMELERHGIVRLQAADIKFPGLFNVLRQQRDLKA